MSGSDRSQKKGVSFDETISIIGVSEPEIDLENEEKILKQFLKPEYNDPKKLFAADSKATNSLASKLFLGNLQQVMNQKCQIEKKVPEPEEPSELYVKKNGAWVLKQDIESQEKLAKINQEFQKEDND